MSELFNLNQFYELLAPLYGPVMRLLPMWQGYTEAVLPHLAGCERVLEIGPGPGGLLTQIAGRHALAAGLDRSRAMLRQAARQLARDGRTRQLCQGDATGMPLAGDAFDAVTSTFALSAIPAGLEAMREIARVLRPGGVAALVDAFPPGDGNRAGVLLCRLWQLGGDTLHDVAALMRAAGLEVVHEADFGAFNSIHLTVGKKGNL